MHKFEKFLIDKGYIRHVFSHKLKTYIPADESCILSTMGYLYFYYIHESDPTIKILQSNLPLNKGDLRNIIKFGLSEHGKPPTLIYPRPKIRIRITEDYFETELIDDSMNKIFEKYSCEKIFEAMYDRRLCLKDYRLYAQ